MLRARQTKNERPVIQRLVQQPSDTVVADVLLHIPHASAVIPLEEQGRFLLADSDLERELLKVTDWFTDDLFELDGGERLVFGVSRLLVDPERFADDEQEVMFARGLGAVYTRTHDGKLLKSAKGRAKLLATYYQPHHDALNTWTTRALEAHGRCLIIDCHSFPSTPLPCDLDQSPNRPDFCIGTAEIHTPPRLVDAATDAINNLTGADNSVLVNRPYKGSMVPSQYYGRDPRVCSIMIEVRRGLYMDEETGERSGNYGSLRALLTSVLTKIATAWSEDAFASEVWEKADPDQCVEPVKRAFERAVIGNVVGALSELVQEDSWQVPEALLLATVLREGHPGIRQLIEYVKNSGSVPMYTSNWVVTSIRKQRKPYEITDSSGSRRVGFGDYSVDVVSYYVPEYAVLCLEYTGGDEIEVHGVKLGSLTLTQANAWISANQPDAEEDWSEEDM